MREICKWWRLQEQWVTLYPVMAVKANSIHYPIYVIGDQLQQQQQNSRECLEDITELNTSKSLTDREPNTGNVRSRFVGAHNFYTCLTLHEYHPTIYCTVYSGPSQKFWRANRSHRCTKGRPAQHIVRAARRDPFGTARVIRSYNRPQSNRTSA